MTSGWRPVAATVAALAMALSGAGTSRAAVRSPGTADGVSTVIERYRATIPELMAREHVPGLAVVVVDGDHVLWQQGFGTTDTHEGAPVTVDTLFSVQSMSKTFTATAVLQAVQAGRLDLDVPITTYLPDFTVHSAFETHPEQRITLRMLLAHTAGFTHEAPVGNNFDPKSPGFDAHVRSIGDTWLRFPVGTGYAYSNLGIDLAGYILEKVAHEPFARTVHDSLLAPLGMDHSTFDQADVHTARHRAVGHSGDLVPPWIDVPMTAAGGLWSTAADLARFLEFQLGDGRYAGRTVLDPALMKEMRTVPAPDEGAPAGYALGVARTHWRAGQYLDLFNHGGGGFGFLSDLWWLPQLQLGIAVLTNSDQHHLQGSLALGILEDLVTEPGSPYRARMLALPTQSDVVEPDGDFLPPTRYGDLLAAAALPASNTQVARWAGYPTYFRIGRLGWMDPSEPVSRFHVERNVAYFDASEKGSVTRHRLVEFRPGLFLTLEGETLDLRGSSPRWRGLALHPVTDGPTTVQWALLLGVGIVTLGWFAAGVAAYLRRRRRHAASSGSPGRRLTTVVAAVGALCALATMAALWSIPGLVDVGFLGWISFPFLVRAAMHLPLAVAVLAGALLVLVTAGALRRWWTPRVLVRHAALAVAVGALAVQLAAWHLVAWGY